MKRASAADKVVEAIACIVLMPPFLLIELVCRPIAAVLHWLGVPDRPLTDEERNRDIPFGP